PIRHAANGRIGRRALRRDWHLTMRQTESMKNENAFLGAQASLPAGVRGRLRSQKKAGKRRSKPIRALIVAAPPDWPGGQSVQAARLLDGLAGEAGVEAELLPIHPRLPGALQLLHEIKYARTIVYTIAYVTLLILRLPRFDVAHIFAASYFS